FPVGFALEWTGVSGNSNGESSDDNPDLKLVDGLVPRTDSSHSHKIYSAAIAGSDWRVVLGVKTKPVTLSSLNDDCPTQVHSTTQSNRRVVSVAIFVLGRVSCAPDTSRTSSTDTLSGRSYLLAHGFGLFLLDVLVSENSGRLVDVEPFSNRHPSIF